MTQMQTLLRPCPPRFSIGGSRPALWLSADRHVGTTGARLFVGANAQRATSGVAWKPGTSDFWLSQWVYVISSPVLGSWLRTGSSSASNYGFWSRVATDGKPYIAINNSTVGTVKSMGFGAALATGQWHHVVFNADRDGNMSCYVNGVLHGTPTDISAYTADLGSSDAGGLSFSGSATYPFDGRASRLGCGLGLLTADDIAELYNQGNGKFYAELSAALTAKVAHYYNCNEGGTGSIIDQCSTADMSIAVTAGTVDPCAGPREATAADLVGGYHGVLTSMDTVNAWKTDTPDGSYTVTKEDSVGSVDGTMTGFADVDAAHVDGPAGHWGPYIQDRGSGGNDGWIVGGVTDSRSLSVPGGGLIPSCFDEKLTYDATLVGYTANPRSATVVPTPLIGKCKSILSVDGKYITTYTKTVTGQGARSVEVWLKRDGIPSGSETIFGEMAVNTDLGLRVYVSSINGGVYVTLGDGSGTFLVNCGYATSICDNAWHHIVFTWDGTTDADKAIMYVDGSPVATATATGTTQGGDSTYNTQIVGINGAATAEWEGYLCRPSIWNARALSAAEVATLYAGGDVTTGLTAEWRFMEEDECLLPDEASLLLNGTTQYVTTEKKPADGMTLAAWVNWDTIDRDESFGYLQTNMNLYLGKSSTGNGRYKWGAGGATATNAVDVPFAAGTWHHHAIALDSGTAKCYVDGVLVNSFNYTFTGTPTGYIYLGARGTAVAPDNFIDGRMAGVKLYSTPLTQAQIRQLAQGIAVGSPVGDWRFDDVLSLPYLSGCKAIRFDGTDDCIDTNTKTVTGQGARSIAFWMRRNGNPAATCYLVAEGSLAASNTGFACDVSTSGTVYCNIGKGDGVAMIHPNINVAGTCDGQWHHICYTWDGTTDANMAKLYLDGVLADSDTAVATSQGGASTTDLHFGMFNGATYPWDGELADIRVYAGVAITQAQIRSIIAGTDYTTGMTAQWKFGETPRSIASCADGYSLEFDGTDDRVATTSAAAVPGAGGACTIAAWVKADTLGASNLGRIIDNGKTYAYVCATSRFACTRSGGSAIAYSANNSLVLGEWMHIAVTSTAAGVTNFYINGVANGAADQDGGAPQDGNTVANIGSNNAASRTFDGKIDDVRVYNTVLSTSDIALLAAGGEPSTAPTAHWTMDDGPQYGEPSDGDPVAVWQDRGTSKINFSQATAGYRPCYDQDCVNGLPGLDFDGAAQYLKRASQTLVGMAGHVFVVVKRDGGSAVQAIVSCGDEGSAAASFWSVGVKSTGVPDINQRSAADTTDSVYGSTTINTDAHLLEYASDGSAYYMRLDNTVQTLAAGSGANNGDWVGNTVNLDNIVLGALVVSTEQRWFDGKILEIIAYDRPLSASEAGIVRRLLAGKYGITLSS